MKNFWTRFLSIGLSVALLLCAAPAVGEEAAAGEEAAVEESADLLESTAEQYIAVATVALKVRRAPEKDARGCDSIPKDAYVYITELGTEWCKVKTSSQEGYVQTKYLSDLREYTPATGESGESVAAPTAAPESAVPAASSSGDFKEGYQAHAVKSALIYKQMDDRSGIVGKIPTYERCVVSYVDGEWCYARYNGRTGYVKVNCLFKWDRIDPYIGAIPGCIVYPKMAFVNKTTNILAVSDNKVLKTINPGSAICVQNPDALGRYLTPYWRTTGYITADDIAYISEVVPYADAQPGDLISVMTTYYALGIHTLNYQGRNWNIYLGTTFISGAIVQPGEKFNINSYMGPYQKSTGYHRAPIASPNKLWGYGGGTCQVCTTVYNTIIQLPLYVDHRKVHSDAGAKYAPKGFDAAVGGGDTNMIFTNTLPYAIRMEFFMSDGVLTSCIYRAE